jgi:hypothetical protein
MHPIFVQLGWNLDGDWPIRKQNPYQHQFVNVNNNNYTCCAKIAGKEETPKCRKKTVTWTNGMIEDLIDFIEIHPIVAFEAIYEPMLTLFWSLISLLRSTLVHNNAIQRAAPSSPPNFNHSISPCNCLFPTCWSFLFSRNLRTTRVVVIIYIHKLMLIRILFSDWSISIQAPSKLKKSRMHFYSIQVRSSFLIQVSCMVYTIKKLEFKKLGCKTCIVYTGLYTTISEMHPTFFQLGWNLDGD